MTAQLNHMAQIWWEWMFPMFWQVSILIILVTLLDMTLRRWAWPQVRYALWGLIFIKLIIPPSWQMPTSVISWIQPKVENRISIQVEPANLITAPSQQASVSSMPQQRQSDPQAITPVTPKLNWKGLAFLFWIAGVTAFSLMLLLKMSRLPKRHKARTQGIAPEWFGDIFAKTTQRLKLRRTPIVVFSRDAKIPAVYGLFRPILLLPDRYFDQFSKGQAEHVLMHELCHLKRGDLFIHWFCILLQIFYWFNPLLIWTRRQMRHVCELCCDLSVANILREETADYRNTLIESTYRLFTETVEPGLGLLGLFEEPFRIASRLKWLEKKTWKNHKRKIIAAAVTGLVMFICVMPMAGRSQSTEQKISQISPSIEAKAGLSDEDAKLIEAATEGDLGTVSAALAGGSDVNARNNQGLTALMKASARGYTDVVKLLLTNGADVNAKNSVGYTALMAASRPGHTDIVRLLLDNGADVNERDADGGTALMGASFAGYTDVVKILLDYGADINAKTIKGETALDIAHENKYADIEQLFKKAGSKKETTPQTNDKKLILAAQDGDLEAARAALTNGEHINATDSKGQTALMWASQKGHADIVKLLLDEGANANVKYKDGGTALMAASGAGHAEVVKLLLNKGVEVNATDIDNKTALMAASEMGHADIVKLLLDKGANVNVKAYNGMTALAAATVRGHINITQMLEKAGADRIIAWNYLTLNILRNAAYAQEGYWVDNQTYTDSIEKLEGAYGLHINEGLTLRIISADKDQYHMIASHEQGDKMYQINGPGGYVEEYSEPGSTSSTKATASATTSSELHLRLIDSTGKPVPFSKAELLIDAWLATNEQTAFPLKTDGNLLVLPLDEEIVHETWAVKNSQWDRNYYLYLEAEGYAPVRSKGIYFIGANGEAVVEFHNGPKITAAKGQKKEIELTLRKPQNRSLLFVDDNHNPVSGVKVKSYMFWSRSNHCGYPQGADLLAEETSDKEGRVAIPDGEFEYLLEFEKELYHLKDTSDFGPMTLITYLSSQETVIPLHKLIRHPLEMVVQKDGRPQANRWLSGYLKGCSCGGCDGGIAVTDENGRISLDEFYPEMWEFISFNKGDQYGTGFAWKADPNEFSGEEVIEVELSE